MIRNPLVNSLMGWYVYMDLLYSNNSHPLSSPPPPQHIPSIISCSSKLLPHHSKTFGSRNIITYGRPQSRLKIKL